MRSTTSPRAAVARGLAGPRAACGPVPPRPRRPPRALDERRSRSSRGPSPSSPRRCSRGRGHRRCEPARRRSWRPPRRAALRPRAAPGAKHEQLDLLPGVVAPAVRRRRTPSLDALDASFGRTWPSSQVVAHRAALAVPLGRGRAARGARGRGTRGASPAVASLYESLPAELVRRDRAAAEALERLAAAPSRWSGGAMPTSEPRSSSGSRSSATAPTCSRRTSPPSSRSPSGDRSARRSSSPTPRLAAPRAHAVGGRPHRQ